MALLPAQWKPFARDYPVDEPFDAAALPGPLGWRLPRALSPAPRPVQELLTWEPPDTLELADEEAPKPAPEPLWEAVEAWYRNGRVASLEALLAERDQALEQRAQEQEELRERLAEALGHFDRTVEAEVARTIGVYQRQSLQELNEAVRHARQEEREALLGAKRSAELEARTARTRAAALETEAGELRAQVAELSQAGQLLAQEREARATAERAQAARISELENQVRRLRNEVQELRERPLSPDLGPVRAPLDAIRTIPHTLAEEVRLFDAVQDRVEFLPSAWESALAYGGRDLDRYWEGLIALHDVLWPLKFEHEGLDLSRAFRERTGFEYAANESPETLAIDECRLARTFKVGDRDILMTNHVKVGNSGNYTDGALRIYLWFDRDRQKLVVGHVGKHLPTRSWLRST